MATSDVRLTFEVECGQTQHGDTVCIVGNDEQLGDWDPLKALKCDLKDVSKWTSETIVVQPKARLEVKAIIVKDRQGQTEVVWEEIKGLPKYNRALRAPSSSLDMKVSVTWKWTWNEPQEDWDIGGEVLPAGGEDRPAQVRPASGEDRPAQVLPAGGGDKPAFYDAVITIGSFTDVYRHDLGWPVRCNHGFDLDKDADAVRVIPLGHFNTGKTWLLGRLCKVPHLPCGTNVHTEGISIKVASISTKNVVLLDTVGANSPIDSSMLRPAACPGTRASSPGTGTSGISSVSSANGLASALEELRVKEDFYRQLAFQVGQVILLVVGQVSHKDQTDLVTLARTIRREKRRQDIVVVHNLREWSRAQMLELGSDGRNYIDRNRDIFDLQDISLEVQLGDRQERVTRHQGLFTETCKTGGDSGAYSSSAVRSSNAVRIVHYYLTNDSLACSLNDFTIEDMRATILTASPQSTLSLGKELATVATKIQGHFVRFTDKEPKIEFVAGEGSQAHFRSELNLPDGSVVVKPPILGSYFTMGLDEVAFNVTAVPCTAVEGASDECRPAEEAGPHERQAYLLQIELPGLENSAAIKELIENGSALSVEPRGGGSEATVTVTFAARLLNLPKKSLTKVEKLVQDRYKGRRVSLVSDCSKHNVLEEGTRPVFPEGECVRMVKIWTNIVDWDKSWQPLVVYSRGILSITLLAEG